MTVSQPLPPNAGWVLVCNACDEEFGSVPAAHAHATAPDTDEDCGFNGFRAEPTEEDDE